MRKGVRLPVLLLLLLRLITLCSVAFVRQAAARLHDNGKALHRQPQSDSNGEQEEEFHVIIGIKEEYRGLGILLRLSRRIRPRFRRANALSAIVKKSELERLMSDPDISYVEEDAMVYPDDNNGNNILMKFEAILYGVSMVQGGVQESIVPITPTATDATATSDRSGDSTTMRHAAAACSNPDSFKIGVRSSKVKNHVCTSVRTLTHHAMQCRQTTV